MAEDEIERLRSLHYGYGPLGEPITNPDIAPTAVQSLDQDTTGAVDFVDDQGATVDVNATAHGAVFTRRWRVTPLDHFIPKRRSSWRSVFFGGRPAALRQ